MAAPDPSHLVEHRLCGVRVLEDIPHREIRHDVGMHEYSEGECHQPELQERRGLRQIHQRTAAHGCPDQRHGALQKRHEKREHEGEMADLYEHLTAPRSVNKFPWIGKITAKTFKSPPRTAHPLENRIPDHSLTPEFPCANEPGIFSPELGMNDA